MSASDETLLGSSSKALDEVLESSSDDGANGHKPAPRAVVTENSFATIHFDGDGNSDFGHIHVTKPGETRIGLKSHVLVRSTLSDLGAALLGKGPHDSFSYVGQNGQRTSGTVEFVYQDPPADFLRFVKTTELPS